MFVSMQTMFEGTYRGWMQETRFVLETNSFWHHDVIL